MAKEHREVVNRIETIKLLKESLKIVDELGTLDENDFTSFMNNKIFDFEKLEKLIKKAQTLKKHRLWILK